MKTTFLTGIIASLPLCFVVSCSSLPEEAPESVTEPAVLNTFDRAIYGQDIPSLITLASYYQEGSHGFPKSSSARIACLQKAAEAGDTATQRKLGLAYLYGTDGCSQNDQKAAKWLSLAAKNGDEVARKGLSTIQQMESAEQNIDKMVEVGRKRNFDAGRAVSRSL